MYRRTRRAIDGWLAHAAARRYRLRPDASWGCTPIALIKHAGMTCRGVVHVGANIGQEFEEYRAAGLECVIYIEPIPSIFAELQQHVAGDRRHHAFEALCTDRDGDEYEFNIASNRGESSSILAMGSHAKRHPEVKIQSTVKLVSRTLDNVVFNAKEIPLDVLDCLVIDVQGAEMKVIKGAHRTLSQCRYIFCEVNEGGLYQGDSSYTEVLAALARHGFRLRSLDLNEHGWGNAFMLKQ
jgi:FkbM family methyltransferase